MNPKALFVILLIAVIIYMGISQKQSICNPPYISHGSDCCIDANQDNICDIDQPKAFVTTPEMTTTTLDPCIGLTGYNKTACMIEKEKRGYVEDCVGQCDNVSVSCLAVCDTKQLPKEKVACADTCLKKYKVCYSDCGASLSDPAKSSAGNATKQNGTMLTIPKIF
jgi:hypothetical protein